ncbi:hypothetical protein Ga0080574_TMP2613 [Salipiger abyssi]|uniref:Uncharacterized protein n=1 Tax=Salipiger abyssi TaxID=1250539 RepID=A0A1P8UU69_9RHOB|nr:hypothetical protein Ga0080574_TMP2613 [Salipiger abyssi]
MAASVTPGRALRYAGGSARGLLHQALGHYLSDFEKRKRMVIAPPPPVGGGF